MRHLRAFIAVAEELNYRRAAKRLHVAQPALSRTIQQLESELGATVLERSTTAVRLSEIGEFFLEQARTIVGSLQAAHRTVHQMTLGQRGQLVVGFNDFTISEFLPPIVQRFRSSFPQVGIDLVDQTSPRMLQALQENRMDIAFLSGIAAPPELDNLVLREERFVVIFPVGHPLARRRQLHLKDLADQPFVMGVPDWSVFLNAVDRYCENAGFRPQVVQTAVHSNGILNLVAAGLGITIYVDRDWLRHRSDVVVRPLPKPRNKFRTLAVWRGNGRSAALSNFITVMREVMRDNRHPG